MDTEQYKRKVRDVLSQHVGHAVKVNGYLDETVEERHLEGDKGAWRFGGFVVHCTTCDVNLSQQWG